MQLPCKVDTNPDGSIASSVKYSFLITIGVPSPSLTLHLCTLAPPPRQSWSEAAVSSKAPQVEGGRGPAADHSGPQLIALSADGSRGGGLAPCPAKLPLHRVTPQPTQASSTLGRAQPSSLCPPLQNRTTHPPTSLLSLPRKEEREELGVRETSWHIMFPLSEMSHNTSYVHKHTL